MNSPSRPRIMVLVSRFNEAVVEGLLAGAREVLGQAGLDPQTVPVVAAELIRQGGVDGIVALGCVIRGETSHHEHVGREAIGGLVRLAMETGVAIGIGVLTVESPEQALVRAGLRPDRGGGKEPGDRHRGREAARACLETVGLLQELRRGNG